MKTTNSNRKKKITKTDGLRAKQHAIESLLNGEASVDVIQQLREMLRVSRKQAQIITRRAYAHIQKDLAVANVAERAATCGLMLRRIATDAKASGNHKDAIAAVRVLAELEGLNAPKQVAVLVADATADPVAFLAMLRSEHGAADRTCIESNVDADAISPSQPLIGSKVHEDDSIGS